MVNKEYLLFTRRERIGIITLVIILIITAVVPKLVFNAKRVPEELTVKQMESLSEKKSAKYTAAKYHKKDTVYVREYVQSKYPKFKSQTANDRWSKPHNKSGKSKSNEDRKPGWVRNSLQPIDINVADTAAFIALPGIGSKLANRIVSFRNKLGGFHSVDQIKQVYGLQDSVFLLIYPLLRCENGSVAMVPAGL